MTAFNRIRNLRGRMTLRPQLKATVIVVSAGAMLIAYLLLSPWIQFNAAAFGGFPSGGTGAAVTDESVGGTTAPAPEASTGGGFQPPVGDTGSGSIQVPEGFDPSQLPEGFDPSQLPEGFDPSQLPEGFQPPSGTGAAATGFPAGGGMQNTGQFLVPLGAVIALALVLVTTLLRRFYALATGLTLLAGVGGLVFFVLFFVQDAVIPINLVDMAAPGFWVALVGSMGLVVQVVIPRPRSTEQDEGDVTEVVPASVRKGGGLSLTQNLRVAVDALLANKLRSGLTMLGVIIGVASVVSLLAVGQGAQSAITEQIQGTGLNQLTINSGGGLGLGAGGGGGGTRTLTYSDAEAIEDNVSGIDAVLPQFSETLRVRSDQENLQTTILGTTEQYAEARNIIVEIGRYFSEAENQNGVRVAVLGQGAAEDLFGGLNPVGRDIRIDGKRFEVIGVLEQQDSAGFNDPNAQIYVPLITGYRNLFDARVSGSSDYSVSSIIVAVTNSDDVSSVQSEIEAVLREAHRLEEDEDNDFSVLDQGTLLDTASTITGILTVLLGAIASISLLVGGIGIMNIMLVSVTERTKEIGLRKAIGARHRHILQQFLIETVFLSVLGGIIGVLLGVGIALLVNASGLLTTTVSFSSIALGLGFSAIIGVFFGVYPANQAASLQPIEALRYE